MGFPTLGHGRYKFPSLRALIMLEESKKNTVVVSTNYTSPVPGRATASASSSSCSQSENSCCGTSSSNKGDEEDVNVDLTEQKKANDTQELRLVLFLVLKDEHEMCARTIYYTNIDNKGDEEDVNVDLTEQKKANDEHEMRARTIYYTNIDNDNKVYSERSTRCRVFPFPQSENMNLDDKGGKAWSCGGDATSWCGDKQEREEMEFVDGRETRRRDVNTTTTTIVRYYHHHRHLSHPQSLVTTTMASMIRLSTTTVMLVSSLFLLERVNLLSFSPTSWWSQREIVEKMIEIIDSGFDCGNVICARYDKTLFLGKQHQQVWTSSMTSQMMYENKGLSRRWQRKLAVVV
ncbi:hypothetical protein F2Q70_00003107 [Brassica cretica]|uniref:Uncharacterized protein n=1 Tax=Brassica cretica TaxID=69181 RepID=A0A8S9IQ72_BRACR|nr:hypothetical protein F2Q70_00003107 [Brassica cretica]